MLIYDFDSHVNPSGLLEIPLPGYGNPIVHIAPWEKGFRTLVTRRNRAVEQIIWFLRVFPHGEGPPPGSGASDFFSAVPEEIRERLHPFEFGQCAMLHWMARHPAALDLCKSNANLLWLTAAAVYDSGISEAELPALLSRKQVEILGRIAGCASAAGLKLLKKVTPHSGDLREARDVIRALSVPAVLKVVSHQQNVSPVLLRMLFAHPGLASVQIIRCLLEASEQPDCRPRILARDIEDTVGDIRRMAGVLGIENPDRDISRCQSVSDLYRMHQRWVGKVCRREELWLDERGAGLLDELHTGTGLQSEGYKRLLREDFVFPAAPFADSGEIRAIRSMRELVIESLLQKNCVWSYGPRIIEGDSRIYKVLSPQRATLEIVRYGTEWKLHQLKLSCNRQPGRNLEKAVRKWIAECNERAAEDGDKLV